MSKKGKLVFYKFRHFIIAIIIIIIVIILDIIFENYSKNLINKIDENIDRINSIFERKSSKQYDISKLNEISENAKEEWKKREQFLY